MIWPASIGRRLRRGFRAAGDSWHVLRAVQEHVPGNSRARARTISPAWPTQTARCRMRYLERRWLPQCESRETVFATGYAHDPCGQGGDAFVPRRRALAYFGPFAACIPSPDAAAFRSSRHQRRYPPGRPRAGVIWPLHWRVSGDRELRTVARKFADGRTPLGGCPCSYRRLLQREADFPERSLRLASNPVDSVGARTADLGPLLARTPAARNH